MELMPKQANLKIVVSKNLIFSYVTSKKMTRQVSLISVNP